MARLRYLRAALLLALVPFVHLQLQSLRWQAVQSTAPDRDSPLLVAPKKTPAGRPDSMVNATKTNSFGTMGAFGPKLEDTVAVPASHQGARIHMGNYTSAGTASSISVCMMVRDDTIKLTEWLAYHYTVLPLGHIIVSIDGGTKQQQVIDIFEEWDHKLPDLSVTLWRNDSFLEEVGPYEGWSGRRTDSALTDRQEWKRKQNVFCAKCLREMKRRNKGWVLLIDTDEFVIYNYPHNNTEDMSRYDYSILPREGTAKVDADRQVAEPIRNALPALGRQTIVEFVESTTFQNYLNGTFTPHCIRIPGIVYNNDDSLPEQIQKDVPTNIPARNFMTLRYRNHEIRTGAFGKVMLDLSHIGLDKINIRAVRSVHNPNRNVCGKGANVAGGGGKDYISSILRFNHYIGSFAAFMERREDFGMVSRKVNQAERRKSYLKRAKLHKTVGSDDDIRPWIRAFLDKVGTRKAEELLRLLITQEPS